MYAERNRHKLQGSDDCIYFQITLNGRIRSTRTLMVCSCRSMIANNHIERLMFLASYLHEGSTTASASATAQASINKLLPKVVRYARAILAMLWEHAELRADFAVAHWRERDFLGNSALATIATKTAPATTDDNQLSDELADPPDEPEPKPNTKPAANGAVMRRSQSIPVLSARPAATATAAPIAPSASVQHLSIRPPRASASGGLRISAPQSNGPIRPPLAPLGPSRLAPHAPPLSIRPPRVATASFSGQMGALNGGVVNPAFSASVPQLQLASASSFPDVPMAGYGFGFGARAGVGGPAARTANVVRPPTHRPQPQQDFGVPSDRTVLWTRRANVGASLAMAGGASGRTIAPPRIPAGGLNVQTAPTTSNSWV